jgi:hypothetical protein
LKEGTLIRTFEARDGRKVTLRAPRWSDVDDFTHFINSLVEEGADILMDKKVTREEEIDFVSHILSALEKDKMVARASKASKSATSRSSRSLATPAIRAA